MTEQSYSVQPSALLAFASELQTQLDGIAVPMNALAAQSGAQPQFGAFAEAWLLTQGQQAAVEQMQDLLGQVRQAIGFAENVTSAVADAYQQADQDAAASYLASAESQPMASSASAPSTGPGSPMAPAANVPPVSPGLIQGG